MATKELINLATTAQKVRPVVEEKTSTLDTALGLFRITQQAGQALGNQEAARVQAEVSSAAQLAKTGGELQQRVNTILDSSPRLLRAFSPQLQATITQQKIGSRDAVLKEQVELQKLEERNLISTLNSVSNKFLDYNDFERFSKPYIQELSNKNRGLSPETTINYEGMLRKAEIYYKSPAMGDEVHDSFMLDQAYNESFEAYKKNPGESNPGGKYVDHVLKTYHEYKHIKGAGPKWKRAVMEDLKSFSDPASIDQLFENSELGKVFSSEEKKEILNSNSLNYKKSVNLEEAKKDEYTAFVYQQNLSGEPVYGPPTGNIEIDSKNDRLKRTGSVKGTNPLALVHPEVAKDLGVKNAKVYNNEFVGDPEGAHQAQEIKNNQEKEMEEDFPVYVHKNGLLNGRQSQPLIMPGYDKKNEEIIGLNPFLNSFSTRVGEAVEILQASGYSQKITNIASKKEIETMSELIKLLPPGQQYAVVDAMRDKIDEANKKIPNPARRLDASGIVQRLLPAEAMNIMSFSGKNGKQSYEAHERLQKQSSAGDYNTAYTRYEKALFPTRYSITDLPEYLWSTKGFVAASGFTALKMSRMKTALALSSAGFVIGGDIIEFFTDQLQHKPGVSSVWTGYDSSIYNDRPDFTKGIIQNTMTYDFMTKGTTAKSMKEKTMSELRNDTGKVYVIESSGPKNQYPAFFRSERDRDQVGGAFSLVPINIPGVKARNLLELFSLHPELVYTFNYNNEKTQFSVRIAKGNNVEEMKNNAINNIFDDLIFVDSNGKPKQYVYDLGK